MSIFKYLKTTLFLILIFSESIIVVAEKNARTPNGLVYFYGYPFNTEQEIRTIANTKYIHRAEISIEWKDVFISRNEFDWSFVDKNIEVWKNAGKSVILRVMTANNATYCTSRTLIEQEKIRLVAEGVYADFETNLSEDGYILLQGSIAGNQQKFFELKNNKQLNSDLIQLNSDKKLTSKATYLFQCDVNGLKKINFLKPAFLRILLHSKAHPEQGIVVAEELKFSKKQLFSKEFTLGNFSDYTLKIEIENAEYCQLDNLNLIQSSDSRGKRVAFPDYFSSNFKKMFSHFMREMAKRYNSNSAVDAIVVSGVGRWEEMLLNDNEKQDKAVHNSFYRQWRAYGYTDVNYLKDVVEWSMDLTQRLFPKKEHILQISPMNNGYENEDFIYRRVASMAVAKDISIKQNGMSEKYDTWSATSDPAYVMNRYRYNTQAKRYYETAGQIFRNTMNAMGHPEALFNRVAIDGATNLYLYKSDILEPNVQKYFRYADSLMQHPFISKLYTNLGFFPLANRKKQKFNLLDTIPYYNKWLGIRQYEMQGAAPEFVFDSTLQVHGVRTRAGNPTVFFDIDDRVLYNGMASAILTITYKDKGFDSFNVIVNSRKSGKYELLESIQKFNTNKLCRKSIPLHDFLESADNFKETKPELVIDASNDGQEMINNLEIEFVPLQDFETELIAGQNATKKYHLIAQNDSLSCSAVWNFRMPLAKAEIKYFEGDFSLKSDVLVRLNYDNDPNSIAKKQYYIGGDKEWIPLPIASCAVPKQIQLHVLNKNGVNGTYQAANGKMAYRLYTYKTTETPIPNFDANGIIQLFDFFNSFSFTNISEFNMLKIYKLLSDNTLLEIPFQVHANKVFLSPQHPGSYKIELDNKSIQPTSVGCLLKKMPKY